MDEKFKTMHPQGKQGVNINKAKYDLVRKEILAATAEAGQISFEQLMTAVNRRLEGKFDGSIAWYLTTVKLDLEARGELSRIPGSSPQQLRLGS